jgi:hypothetical protein
MKRAAMLILLFVQLAAAQEILSDRIKGLRVYGSGPAGIPVAELQSQPITVEFDVNEAEPPDLKIRVLHCDRDWNVTQNGFLNDVMQNRSKAPLAYDRAPDGVRLYRYHYVVRIPGITGIERLAYSGNYVFEILDERSTSVLGRGRFFVVEKLLPLTTKIGNRSLPSGTNPYNQVKKIEVGFSIPKSEGMNGETFFPLLLKVTDIYRNRQLYNPWRIDADDQDPDTFVDGFGTPALKFVNQNVPPGNSYRTIDLSDVTAYPEDRLLRSTKGADVSRFQMPPGSDHHGRSEVIAGSRYGDYVPFRFELASEEPQWEQVYVVGDFNAWRPAREWLMTYDATTQRYICDVSIRRGVYDYQYVVGPNDWIAVEGNDWRTSNAYSAFVYYRDNRLGGYDRIIGFAQWVGTGRKESTSQ